MPAPEQKFATRLNSFRAGGALAAADALARVADVPGISAVELNFPQHFEGADVIAAARAAGLETTALNLRWDGPDFAMGAFTNPDPAARDKAAAQACAAVDRAAAEGVGHVILWMGPDGVDYPFQADYARLWDWEAAGFRAAAGRDPRVRISVEYKPSDPRRLGLIRTMGDALCAVHEVGAENFGVTLDLCHALMTGESPAAAAAMAIRAGKLFGVHVNDGYGPADDGLMAGTVRPFHLFELLWELRRGGFAGTIYFDTFPERADPAAECAANVAMVRRLLRRLDRLDDEALARARDAQDAVAASRLVQRALFGDD